MTFNSTRWGRAFTALVLVGAQVAACGSPAKKKVVPQFNEAGAGGEVASAGRSPVAGASGRAPVGGEGGSGAEDAGAPGTGAAGGDEPGGAASTAGAAGTVGSGGVVGIAGSVGSGGTAGVAGAAGTGGTAGTVGTAGSSGTAGAGGIAGTAGTGPACAAPSSVITTAATAVHGDTLVVASVPSQASLSYAWSMVGGSGTINGLANKNTVAFDVGATGSEVILQAVVTNTLTSCSSTTVQHIPIPCQPPLLVSADGLPATPHAVTGNEDTGQFDMTSSSNIWTGYFVAQGATASYSGAFNHFNGTTWGRPAGAPLIVNDSAAHLLYYKVVTDTAGDAVFVWTQTTDNNNYTVMVSAYRVSDGAWSTPLQVGTVFDHQTPVDVKINRATGVALIAWAQGPYLGVIAHLRSFTVSSGTLGADLALRPSTTNTYSGASMSLGLETNDSLTGFAAWVEHDSVAGVDALYALHITAGVPDVVSTAYDIKQLVLGGSTYSTDLYNQYSVHGASEDRQPRMVAVSANGTAAVMWSAFNGGATGANKAQLYVRRYISGAWSAAEVAAAQTPSISAFDWGVDDAGNVLAEVWTNNTGYDFYSGVLGSAWSAAQHLTAYNGGITRISVDSVSGKAMLTFRDPALSSRAPLRGLFYDPTTHALSPAFTMDDPTQSGGEVAHLRVDSTGLGTVLFTQIISPLPQGANSSNSALLYSTTCK